MILWNFVKTVIRLKSIQIACFLVSTYLKKKKILAIPFFAVSVIQFSDQSKSSLLSWKMDQFN
jgi:hypothetical protein